MKKILETPISVARLDRGAATPAPRSPYEELVERVRAVVATALPAGATVVVVSKGDPQLVDLRGFDAWHFPQREDGVYAGYYPPGSGEAIAHLEALRERGAEYLVFPRTAFWWLERGHYDAFRDHLQLHYRLLLRREDTCLVFSLREPPLEVSPTVPEAAEPAERPHPAPSAAIDRSGARLRARFDESRLAELRILFDASFYAEQAGRRFASDDAALLHFLDDGWKEGHDPNAIFDTSYYLDRYPDVRALGANPLLHFLTHGAREGHDPGPLFDTGYYHAQAPHLRGAGVNPLVHYLEYAADNRAYHPNPLFSNGYYLDLYRDVKGGRWNPLVHFIRFGCREGRYASHVHQNVMEALHRSSGASLLRGSWKSDTVLLVTYGEARGEGRILPQIAEVLSRDYHLGCVVLANRREDWLGEFGHDTKLVVLDDFQVACDVQRPSALRLLASTLAGLRPLFALCETADMMDALSVSGVPAYYLFPDYAVFYAKPVLERLVRQARRVVFSSSDHFHSVAWRTGGYPVNVALRPFPRPALADFGSGRELARAGLLDALDRDGDPFLVLGGDTPAGRGGFELFLAAARMLRRRRPDLDAAFVWVSETCGETDPGASLRREEIRKSELRRVVYALEGEDSVVARLTGADTLLLPSLEDPAHLVAEAATAGIPAVCFDGSLNGSRSLVDDRFVVPYLDVEAVCDRLEALHDERAGRGGRVDAVLAPPPAETPSAESYVASLMELVERDVGLPDHVRVGGAARHAGTSRKVVIPCCDWGLSGVNSCLEAVGQELIRLGWDAEIVFTRDRAAILESAGGEEHLPRLPHRFLEATTPGLEGSWESLIAYLERNAPCIMFMTYDFSANSVAPALTDRVGAVTWLQADDGDYYEQAYRVGRYCNSVVCVSECIREKVADLNPVIGGRARVIHNSSVREEEISPRKSVSRDRLRLVYTGRLVQYQKRVLDFVDLARSLDRRDVPYELTLVGDFSPLEGIRDTFEARARAHLADGRIRVLRRMPRAQVLDELTRHDVFVLLSDFEGLPLALIEAMAKGCVPVVADMESGIAEAVRADENGLIVGGRDYDRWAERIAELWESPRLLAEMSKRARRTVRDRFTVERVAMQFDDLFSGVLHGISSGEYRRPPSLHWGAKRSLTGDVLPPPNLYRPVHR